MASDPKTPVSEEEVEKSDEEMWSELETAERAGDPEDDDPPAEPAEDWPVEGETPQTSKAAEPPQSDDPDPEPSPPEKAGDGGDDPGTDETAHQAEPTLEDLKKQLEERDLLLADREQQLRTVKGYEAKAQRKLQELLLQQRKGQDGPPADRAAADDTPSDEDRDDGKPDAGKKPRNKYTPEQMAALREDYPDLAALFDTIDDLTESQKADEEFRIQVQADLAQQEDNRRATEWDKFAAVHNDGTEFVHKNYPAFEAWLDNQPGAIRRIAEANMEGIVDGERTATIISRFKEFMGVAPAKEQEQKPPPDQQSQPRQPLPPKRQKQLQATSGPTSRGRTPIQNGPPADMSDEEAWKYWTRVDEQKDRRRA